MIRVDAPSPQYRSYRAGNVVQLSVPDNWRQAQDGNTLMFAPNGAFIVTGSRERHVLVWPVPAEQEVRQEIVAEAPRFDDLYEGTKRQRKIWAELANPGGRLTPGDTVTMVIYPLQ